MHKLHAVPDNFFFATNYVVLLGQIGREGCLKDTHAEAEQDQVKVKMEY